MSLLNQSKQQKVVYNLLLEVKAQSAKTVANRRALTDRKKAIIGRPTVMVWAFAAGAYLASRRSRKKSPELSAVRASGVSALSVLNTGLAVWALLKRVDLLNQSNANINPEQEINESKTNIF